jgi:hypothetical protein
MKGASMDSERSLYEQMMEFDTADLAHGTSDRLIPADIWEKWLQLAQQYDYDISLQKKKKPKRK